MTLTVLRMLVAASHLIASEPASLASFEDFWLSSKYPVPNDTDDAFPAASLDELAAAVVRDCDCASTSEAQRACERDSSAVKNALRKGALVRLRLGENDFSFSPIPTSLEGRQASDNCPNEAALKACNGNPRLPNPVNSIHYALSLSPAFHTALINARVEWNPKAHHAQVVARIDSISVRHVDDAKIKWGIREALAVALPHAHEGLDYGSLERCLRSHASTRMDATISLTAVAMRLWSDQSAEYAFSSPESRQSARDLVAETRHNALQRQSARLTAKCTSSPELGDVAITCFVAGQTWEQLGDREKAVRMYITGCERGVAYLDNACGKAVGALETGDAVSADPQKAQAFREKAATWRAKIK